MLLQAPKSQRTSRQGWAARFSWQPVFVVRYFVAAPSTDEPIAFLVAHLLMRGSRLSYAGASPMAGSVP